MARAPRTAWPGAQHQHPPSHSGAGGLPLAHLEEAQRARKEAADLLKRAQQDAEKKWGQRQVRRRDTTAEIGRALALFDTPHAARQAIIASIVLAPPPGLSGQQAGAVPWAADR